MKKFTYTIAILLAALMTACTIESVGPQGDQGPAGPEGPAGESAYIFEFENINFTAPNYEVFLDYPNDFEGLNTDVALVYFLYGVENVEGEDLDVWRLLPQTVVTDNGILQYNYDFTMNDVRLFLQADFSKEILNANETDEWIARVIIVPGDFFVANGRLNLGDYKSVIESLQLNNLPLPGSYVNRIK